jgi:hypothetical protein
MSKFTEVWKDIAMPPPSLPLFGLGEIVSYGGYRWEVTGFEVNKKESCWMYDLKRVDGSNETENNIHEPGLIKSYKKSEYVEKPSASSHTANWDSCVEHVENNSKGVNAYAVCTAMLGDESFKSMAEPTFGEKIKMYMHKLGIAGAGPIPTSLLAEQDLEGREKSIEKGTDLNNFAVWYYDPSGARKCAVFGHLIDADAYARIVESLGYKNVQIMKGQVEQTGKELKEAAEDAEDAKETETKSLVNRIKNIQLKRQNAIMRARGTETNKSFKQAWNEAVGRSAKINNNKV